MPIASKIDLNAPSKQLPDTLLIGAFTLKVEAYTETGRWDAKQKRQRLVSGKAWLSFGCLSTLKVINPFDKAKSPALLHSLEVVEHVMNPQTQVSLDAARLIQPGIQTGQTLQVEAQFSKDILNAAVSGELNLVEGIKQFPPKGQVFVEFKEVTIEPILGSSTGRIVVGSAMYPTKPAIPKKLVLEVEGFGLTLDSLTLTPKAATAEITALLPGGMVDEDACTPASLNLGKVVITPACSVYVHAPEVEFGPWIAADTGLVISGKGYTLDLSLAQSPTGKPAGWRGLLLHSGKATGADLVPEPSNTGYLRGEFSFSQGELTKDGLDAHLALSQAFSFETFNPIGYTLSITDGWLLMIDSKVSSGEFGPGQIDLPKLAICTGAPGSQLSVNFTKLQVDHHLDLAGEVDCGSGLDLAWGELTRPGEEQVFWNMLAGQGFLYLPANPFTSFCPASSGGFLDLWLSSAVDYSLTQLKTYQIAGLTFRDFRDLRILSPDRPGGKANPLEIKQLQGWQHVGTLGLDGTLETYWQMERTELGEPARPGYVGQVPFNSMLFGRDKRNLVAQYVVSAAYDSSLDGIMDIPAPCSIPELSYQDMKLTSTAHLVGGDVTLPPGGVSLDYWQLQLVPTGPPSQAGVISVRTGCIIFTAAGISEPIHFDQPFRLTWGEMLADGNLGELFFDFNNYGQRFDHIPYAPQKILLSKYNPGTTDAYLATCGDIHFTFFGPRFANLRDARYHDASDPFFNRYVTSPKTGEPGWPATDLYLAKNWDDLTGAVLAIFDFPDAQMDYFEAAQNGFTGSGTSDISFFHSDVLDAIIEIQQNVIDIRMSSAATHDLDLGLYASVGGMREICGCARIETPLLSRISFYGLLEHSASTGSGILSPKVGAMVEVNISVTPNSLDFSAAGDLLMQVAGSAVDLSASVHLFYDFSAHSAEGEVIGRIDCNSVIGGLEGEGQVTWFASPTMQYLQGRMKVFLCGWTSSGGLEGGFFLGHNVDKALAWVLKTDSEHFGVSDAILPAQLTGLFGYGRLAFSLDLFLFGGGIELYAGMGAFSESPLGLVGALPVDWSENPTLGLPYFIGSCGVYVHGEILGGLVSASAWADLDLRGPIPLYFEGSFGLEGCVVWVICASIEVTAGFNSGGFYLS